MNKPLTKEQLAVLREAMSDTKVRPALTPEEWGDFARGSWVKRSDNEYEWDADDDGFAVLSTEGTAQFDSPEDRHTVAALALRGQPFGFTWDDVDALVFLADESGSLDLRPDLRDLANRVAALLPPR